MCTESGKNHILSQTVCLKMEIEQGWDFNAPQYIDFTRINAEQDDDNVEEYFGELFC